MDTPVQTSLDPRYSAAEAAPVPWADAVERLRRAERWLVTTVRPDGRPHQSPVVGAVHAGVLWFCSGAHERKSLNLAGNPSVLLTAPGGPGGLDVVVEGTAEVVEDEPLLREVAEAVVAAHDESWRFSVSGGRFHHGPAVAVVFRVRPVVGFGFATGNPPGQTRWRFGAS
ncbi:pyridoxamine 5'-phosphate oxidase family protein [Kineococcus rhizosphaerae]|uniref:Pyridoxamine 5'-phosphate oxidase n=1 Tax=Kineococcus rhizosphaerae TaxID=559628 RepID=A0A2T0R7W0_9ACTN|nr:pyridoxamine 5'-phosphate oxidase family protein [Kineococcus rhizosphaerae]PRY17241.1 pyridoxamine 5'-phosphate oxidase [Kineococcus rhizosphaerae]